MAVPRSRNTVAGHVPTSWAKPHRTTVVLFALAAGIADAFVWLTAPEGMLDAELVYGPAHVRSLLYALQDEGRAAYRASAMVDLAFIVLYTTLLIHWIRFFRNRKVRPTWMRPWIGVFPGVFDLVETVGVLMLLRSFPDLSGPLVMAVVVATPLKWLGLLGVTSLLVAGEIGWWKKRRRRRK